MKTQEIIAILKMAKPDDVVSINLTGDPGECDYRPELNGRYLKITEENLYMHRPEGVRVAELIDFLSKVKEDHDVYVDIHGLSAGGWIPMTTNNLNVHVMAEPASGADAEFLAELQNLKKG